jgi:hypothetical protein
MALIGWYGNATSARRPNNQKKVNFAVFTKLLLNHFLLPNYGKDARGWPRFSNQGRSPGSFASD